MVPFVPPSVPAGSPFTERECAACLSTFVFHSLIMSHLLLRRAGATSHWDWPGLAWIPEQESIEAWRQWRDDLDLAMAELEGDIRIDSRELLREVETSLAPMLIDLVLEIEQWLFEARRQVFTLSSFVVGNAARAAKGEPPASSPHYDAAGVDALKKRGDALLARLRLILTRRYKHRKRQAGGASASPLLWAVRDETDEITHGDRLILNGGGQPFLLLKCLLSRAGEVVEYAELRRAVKPDVPHNGAPMRTEPPEVHEAAKRVRTAIKRTGWKLTAVRRKGLRLDPPRER